MLIGKLNAVCVNTTVNQTSWRNMVNEPARRAHFVTGYLDLAESGKSMELRLLDCARLWAQLHALPGWILHGDGGSKQQREMAELVLAMHSRLKPAAFRLAFLDSLLKAMGASNGGQNSEVIQLESSKVPDGAKRLLLCPPDGVNSPPNLDYGFKSPPPLRGAKCPSPIGAKSHGRAKSLPPSGSKSPDTQSPVDGSKNPGGSKSPPSRGSKSPPPKGSKNHHSSRSKSTPPSGAKSPDSPDCTISPQSPPPLLRLRPRYLVLALNSPVLALPPVEMRTTKADDVDFSSSAVSAEMKQQQKLKEKVDIDETETKQQQKLKEKVDIDETETKQQQKLKAKVVDTETAKQQQKLKEKVVDTETMNQQQKMKEKIVVDDTAAAGEEETTLLVRFFRVLSRLADVPCLRGRPAETVFEVALGLASNPIEDVSFFEYNRIIFEILKIKKIYISKFIFQKFLKIQK
jgi:hypothetical protein